MFKKHHSLPLADKLRPTSFAEIYGQEHLFGEQASLLTVEQAEYIPSIILWGPPGCGKTTLARLLTKKVGGCLHILSAVISGTAEFKEKFKQAEQNKNLGSNTVLLVDEIHRLNCSQQDIFLPYIENGTITLIGTTTENPSFDLNSALLSRCKILIIKRLEIDALLSILKRAEKILQVNLPLTEEAKISLCEMADGDGRCLLNLCEELLNLKSTTPLTPTDLAALVQGRMPVYDKNRDQHYNMISALHKSLRGSDCDASLYWLARMLHAGENPLYIIRRLIRCASEDIGLADPNALQQALAAKDAFEVLGSPEGELAIAQATVYLATAPKSNAVYAAYKEAASDAKKHGSLAPPRYILNAPTKLMKQEGYGKGYIYDHDTKECFSGQNYFPESMPMKIYYHPVERGFEREIKKRLQYWSALRKSKNRP